MAEQRAEGDHGETYTPFKADHWVEDGVDLRALWGVPASLVPVPGHTDGSLVVVVGEAAFVGDLFRGGIVGGGVETHFYMCDLDDNRRDIAALLEAWPQVKTFFPGHFGPVSRGAVEAYLREAQESAER
jgi:glyoxylase-like metal-dependent hydrolase (beta-lactamase superfamily II)